MLGADHVDIKGMWELKKLGKEHFEKQQGWDEHSYWYGSKVDIRSVNAPDPKANNSRWGLPDMCLKVSEPELVAGMFITLGEFWPKDHFNSGMDFADRLGFYQYAADIVQTHELESCEFDASFVRYFFQILALSLSKMVGQIEYILANEYDKMDFVDDQTRLLCDQTTFDIEMVNTHSFYFAYGSNMDPQQMHHRCPGAKAIAIGRFDGHRLIINSRGVATVVSDQNSACHGVIWSVTEPHLRSLDQFEGVRYGTYTKELAKVKVGNQVFDTVVYVASNNQPGFPRTGYLEKLTNGAKFFGAHQDWLEEISSLNCIDYIET